MYLWSVSMPASQVKGVQFNYVNFLWKEISWITEMEKQGEYHQALRSLLDLFNRLPKEIFGKVQDQAIRIPKEIAFLRLQVKMRAIDSFNRRVVERRVLNVYARGTLRVMMRNFSDILDKRHYFEKTSPEVPTGRSHTI